MKKILSLLLASVLGVCCLAGCSEDVNKNTVVATVNGTKVTADFYNFYLTQVKKSIEQQFDSSDVENIWEDAELEGKKLIDTAREKALDSVIDAIIVEQKAADYGIVLSDDENSAIEQQISSTVAQQGSRPGYEEWLKEQGLTDEMYRRFIKINYLSSKLSQMYSDKVTDEALNEYYNKNVARVKHILVSTLDDKEQPLPEASKAEKKAFAEELLARARGGESFESLVEQYSEDPGSKSQPDGYYLGKGYIVGSQGSMVSEFEAMSLALEVGGISEPVETSYGYHIIKRYENDPAVLEANKDQIRSYAVSDEFSAVLESWKTSAKVEVESDLINKM